MVYDEDTLNMFLQHIMFDRYFNDSRMQLQCTIILGDYAFCFHKEDGSRCRQHIESIATLRKGVLMGRLRFTLTAHLLVYMN